MFPIFIKVPRQKKKIFLKFKKIKFSFDYLHIQYIVHMINDMVSRLPDLYQNNQVYISSTLDFQFLHILLSVLYNQNNLIIGKKDLFMMNNYSFFYYQFHFHSNISHKFNGILSRPLLLYPYILVYTNSTLNFLS